MIGLLVQIAEYQYFKEDYNNFWANIESAFDYYLEPLDYIDNIKIGTMKIRKCLKYFNGTDCRSYNEIIDILKPNELERYKKKRVFLQVCLVQRSKYLLNILKFAKKLN